MLAQHKRFWAEVDLDAIRHNFNAIKACAAPTTKICCVIKANAYGHGAICLAKQYEALGAHYFAVSNIEEAIQLRENSIQLPILILGYTPPACAGLLADYHISQAVFSLPYALELNSFASQNQVNINIHIKLDSGMGRIGFDCKNQTYLKDALQACQLSNLTPEGIFTHFAVADEGEKGKAYTRMQYQNFANAVHALAQHGISFSIHHCANSAAISDYVSYQPDMVRAGIVLYGEQPSHELDNPLNLRQTMRLKGIVSQVKTIKAGECVSYGCTFRAQKDMQIATVPVGYADGFWRCNAANGGYALVHGQKAPIVGRICMDQLMLNVDSVPNVQAGDVVTFMGQDGAECITATDIADRNNTISYEILCAVGERVPRIYMEGDRAVAVKDSLLSSKLIEN